MLSRPAVARGGGHNSEADSYRRHLSAAAVTVGAVAAALLSFGGVLPVVSGGQAGYSSAPLLIVLAVAPVILAAALLLRRRDRAAAGVLAGMAALAPGRIVLDLQFAADAASTSRPALYLPATLGSPSIAAGFWLLLGGQVGFVAAGLLAVRTCRDGAETAESDAAGEPDPAAAAAGQANGPHGARKLLLFATCAAALAALGLLMAPFTSADAYLLARSPFTVGGLVLAGSLLVAGALPLSAALAVSSQQPEFARGCLVGLGCGVLTVCLPDLFAAVSMNILGVSAGPLVAIAGAAGLLALAVARPTERGSAQPDDVAGHARVPSRRRLEAATGIIAVLTGAASLAGALTSQVTSATGGAVGESPTHWSLVVAGLLTGTLGATLFVGRYAATVRPALSVAWAAVPLAGMSVLGAGVAAGQTGGVLVPGPGVLWTVLAMVLAAGTACLSAVAGMVEREDVQTGAAGGRPRVVVVVGGVLAAAGFALPMAGAADYAGPGLVVNTVTASWGLLVGLVAVLAAVVLAPQCRPTRAAALLAGAACLLGLRAAEWPLTALRVGGLEPGPGWWFAVAATVTLAVAAVTMAASTDDARDSRPAAQAS